MDGLDFTRYVLDLTRDFLKKSDLIVPLIAKAHADELLTPVRIADRIVYYTAGLKLWGKRERWPFRDRKVGRSIIPLNKALEESDLTI